MADASPAEAVIVGDIEDDSAVMFGAADALERTSKAVLYVSSSTAWAVRPDAVPRTTQRAFHASQGTPYERFLLARIDGQKTVAELGTGAKLTSREISTTLLTLLDRGFIELDVSEPETSEGFVPLESSSLVDADPPVTLEASVPDLVLPPPARRRVAPLRLDTEEDTFGPDHQRPDDSRTEHAVEVRTELLETDEALTFPLIQDVGFAGATEPKTEHGVRIEPKTEHQVVVEPKVDHRLELRPDRVTAESRADRNDPVEPKTDHRVPVDTRVPREPKAPSSPPENPGSLWRLSPPKVQARPKTPETPAKSRARQSPTGRIELDESNMGDEGLESELSELSGLVARAMTSAEESLELPPSEEPLGLSDDLSFAGMIKPRSEPELPRLDPSELKLVEEPVVEPPKKAVVAAIGLVKEAKSRTKEEGEGKEPTKPKEPPRIRGADPMKDKASDLYQRALEDKEAGNLVSAKMNVKLAMTFDPSNEAYKKAYEEMGVAQPAAAGAPNEKAEKAKQLHDRATQAERLANFDEAVKLLEAAIAEVRDPAYLNRLGVILAMKRGDLERGRKLIEEAVRASGRKNPIYEANLEKVKARMAKKDGSGKESKKPTLLGGLLSRKS